ncbi:unnamed protein product [Gongylonema pulchrum]|uniref:Rab_eff_C domain-containing protein n=1 Tax=Gongylonema pulchrum TaxID=637853 RepID=A0A183EWQ0_9BILA|nr:unnamed protein product [Gongylonema pulchrum]
MLQQRVEELRNETAQLSEIIEEMRDSGSAVGGDASAAHSQSAGNVRENGNGENGWSDFDEFDVDSHPTAVERPKKGRSPCAPRSSPADILEVARLRAQMKNLEADLEQAKYGFSFLHIEIREKLTSGVP